MAPSKLFIGKFAAQVGLNPKTIRYYEALGLLPKPERSEHRYRLYTSEVIDLLRFIKKAQGFGLRLSEVEEIIAIQQRGDLPCRHVRALLKEKLKDLDRKIGELVTLRNELRHLLATWTRRVRVAGSAQAIVCPHLEVLRCPRAHRNERKRKQDP